MNYAEYSFFKFIGRVWGWGFRACTAEAQGKKVLVEAKQLGIKVEGVGLQELISKDKCKTKDFLGIGWNNGAQMLDVKFRIQGLVGPTLTFPYSPYFL